MARYGCLALAIWIGAAGCKESGKIALQPTFAGRICGGTDAGGARRVPKMRVRLSPTLGSSHEADLPCFPEPSTVYEITDREVSDGRPWELELLGLNPMGITCWIGADTVTVEDGQVTNLMLDAPAVTPVPDGCGWCGDGHLEGDEQCDDGN